MRRTSFKNSKTGWFIGSFPEALFSVNFEVGIRSWKANTSELIHYHKLADEINLILEGSCLFIFGKHVEKCQKDDIIIVERNEKCKFVALTDTKLLIIKTNSDQYDKYIAET